MIKGFYAQLDTIVDVVAGTIRRVAPEQYTEAIRSGYHKRKGDFFKDVDPEKFREVYDRHEFETLEAGTLTNVFQFLQPKIAECMTEYLARQMPATTGPWLDVNIYPYELNDNEIAFLRSIIYIKIGGIVGVNIINKPYSELTPSVCAEKYNMMLMYNYHHYLNAHSSALIANPKPMLILVAPMVYFNRDPETDEELVDQLKNGINVLAILEASLAPRICLKFINVDVYSIAYPDDRIKDPDAVNMDQYKTIDQFERELAEQRERLKPKTEPEA